MINVKSQKTRMTNVQCFSEFASGFVLALDFSVNATRQKSSAMAFSCCIMSVTIKRRKNIPFGQLNC